MQHRSQVRTATAVVPQTIDFVVVIARCHRASYVMRTLFSGESARRRVNAGQS
jgi:hypothetical protein